MRARMIVENPGEIEMTLKMTMTIKEWENLREQLEGRWPASRLSSAITSMLTVARKTYYAEDADALA